ncbi:MAG: redoxin domain-containing protein [Myxococcales bacterium]|nr:redoxin domain-containing protein [Myxococcales bacterium]
MARFAAHIDQFAQAGAHLVAIGNGHTFMAQAFAKESNLPFPLYTDPSRAVYKLAGLKRNLGLGFKTFKRALEAKRQGHYQTAVAGDPWQQGGVLVINQGGEIIYQHVDDGAGDSANPLDVLASIQNR